MVSCMVKLIHIGDYNISKSILGLWYVVLPICFESVGNVPSKIKERSRNKEKELRRDIISTVINTLNVEIAIIQWKERQIN